MTENQVVEFNEKNVYIGLSKKPYGKTYFANRDFKKGDVVMFGFGKIIDHQTSHISVQIGVNKHYLPKSWTGKYWNHSCDSNTYMNTRKDGFPELIALKPIKRGEEITYSYWMSEFEWIKSADENKVKCQCGEKKCRGKIFSFSHLSKIDQQKLLDSRLCSKYLLKV